MPPGSGIAVGNYRLFFVLSDFLPPSARVMRFMGARLVVAGAGVTLIDLAGRPDAMLAVHPAFVVVMRGDAVIRRPGRGPLAMTAVNAVLVVVVSVLFIRRPDAMLAVHPAFVVVMRGDLLSSEGGGPDTENEK